ncbi:FHA domain-containing protein [Micromonospora sp. WMMA2032]|uniref:FHA domain-containing protein n=1 Tax=Micromonospora TaxID=1873 RepID=UPI000C05AF3B|nr:FHA domain-containing protein [Micromonospora sp. WMMA2032]ATO16721.1 FHA domain-containing protein [Micromonospora sp. WMMA2032]
MEDHPELMPLLTVSGGAMRGLSFRVGRGVQVIGRAPSADIVLADPHLSRRHATVQATTDGVLLTDLGSTNGTWLNDRRISGSVPLADGDVVRLGRTDLRLYDPGVARTDPVGMSFGAPRRDQRPTLPLPVPAPRQPIESREALPVDAR